MKAAMCTPLPGPKSERCIETFRRLNGAYGLEYPFVHSPAGEGCYFQDIDGNTFLDFASQIASNPLGYNHSDIVEALHQYQGRDPLKFAGQDFLVKEHVDFLEALLSITPKELNAAFVINSGAEAVENAVKVALFRRPTAKFVVSFTSAFHGRTLGALSLTNRSRVHKQHLLSIPTKRLPFSEHAIDELERIIRQEAHPEDIGCVILEHVQGEGGYNVAPRSMVRLVRKFCATHEIPYIADEVQSGVGRTGEWWAFQHYGIIPDIMSCAKALKVAATVANKKTFPAASGAISSTWGGGQIIDLVTGVTTIHVMKRDRLVHRAERMGAYLGKRLRELPVLNERGLGLMRAVDLPTVKTRNDVVISALKRGLVLLKCGEKGIRFIPPLIVGKEEIDEAMTLFGIAVKECGKASFSHAGKICGYMDCGHGG